MVGTRKGNMNFEFLILSYELFVTMGTKIANDVPQYAYCSTQDGDGDLLIDDSHRGTCAQNKGAAHQENDDMLFAIASRLETEEWNFAYQQIATQQTTC